jgi:uncharacterized protein (DUF983 family)
MPTLISIIIMFSLLAWCMARVVCRGRKCAATGFEHMEIHKSAVNQALVVTIILIVLVELLVHFSPDLNTPSWLFRIHLLFAIPYLLLLIALRFWISGDKNPKAHKPLGYTTVAAYSGTLITGIAMLFLGSTVLF